MPSSSAEWPISGVTFAIRATQPQAVGAGGSTPARAAVVADAGSTPVRASAIAPLALQHPPTTVSVDERARLAAVTQWNRADARDVAPPEYFGSNTDPAHLAANKASVIRRSSNKSCWLCPEDKLVAGQPHWECKFHGVNATLIARPARQCLARRVSDAVLLAEETGPGPASPPPPNVSRGRGGGCAAALGSWRGLLLTSASPPSRTAGDRRNRPGGFQCIWSDCNSSRREGGGDPPTSTSPAGDRVAPSSGLPAAGDYAARPCWLGALACITRDPPPPSFLRSLG